jgi:hypothetical protein
MVFKRTKKSEIEYINDLKIKEIEYLNDQVTEEFKYLKNQKKYQTTKSK